MKVLLSGIVFYSDELQISFAAGMQRDNHMQGENDKSPQKHGISPPA